MRKPRHQRAGFTLVELLLAITLTGVVFTMASAAFLRFARVHYSLAAQADLDRQFRYAVNVIADDFRGLSGIEWIDADDNADGDGPGVELTLPNLVNADQVLPDRTTVTFTLLADGRLRRHYAEYSAQGEVLGESRRDLLHGVRVFQVERASKPRSFDLTLSCERNAGDRVCGKSVETRLTSRN